MFVRKDADISFRPSPTISFVLSLFQLHPLGGHMPRDRQRTCCGRLPHGRRQVPPAPVPETGLRMDTPGRSGICSTPQTCQMPAPVRYLSERQYEVYQTVSVMRDAMFERAQQNTTAFDNDYEVEFQPLEGNEVRSDRSYIIHLGVRSRTAQELPPPYIYIAPGTQVTMSVLSAHDPVPTEFTGLVISSPPGDDEFGISMVVNRIGGRPGFVLTGHGKQLGVIIVLPSNIDFAI